MTKAEEETKGVLTVDVDYLKLAQSINNTMYMMQKFKDQLDIAAIQKGMKEKERRNGDRRRHAR